MYARVYGSRWSASAARLFSGSSPSVRSNSARAFSFSPFVAYARPSANADVDAPAHFVEPLEKRLQSSSRELAQLES
jgi:hypothetical protein